MDPVKCFEILNSRVECDHDAHADGKCAENDKLGNLERVQLDEGTAHGSVRSDELSEKLVDMCTTNVIKAFLSLQSERVVAYKHYNDCLNGMLNREGGDDFSNYPALCGKMTTKFSAISSRINSVKNILLQREEKNLTAYVSKIQKLEEKKLALTASVHLEMIRFESKLWGEIDDSIKSTMKQNMRRLRLDISELEVLIGELCEYIRFECE